jgi:hypothetical protein
MRIRILLASLVIVFLIASCSSSNKAVSYSEDKAFQNKLKKFNRHPDDPALKKELIDLYELAMKQHEDRIVAYRTSIDLNRYDKILSEYNTMQQIGEAIRSSAAYKFINTINYHQVLQLTREEAAAAWYNAGLDYLNMHEREYARKAYNAFKKTGQYVSNYKDVSVLMQQAFDNSIIDVVINPVTDNNYYAVGTGWNGSYRSNYLQESLVRELGGQYSNSVPARFYTDWDAKRLNLSPDWVIDLNWNNLYIPQPSTSRYTRNLSKNVQIGSDTSGKPVYQTVHATLNVTRRYVTANGSMEYRITELDSRKNIAWNTVRADHSWSEEYATYSGDSRALDSGDWALVNNDHYRTPGRDEIVEELYRKIYPDLKSRIRNEVDW